MSLDNPERAVGLHRDVDVGARERERLGRRGRSAGQGGENDRGT